MSTTVVSSADDQPLHVSQIPDDVLMDKIFARMDTRSLTNVDLTCHTWRALVDKANLWRAHCQALYPEESARDAFLTDYGGPTHSWRSAYLHCHVTRRLQQGAPVLRYYSSHTKPVGAVSLVDGLAATGSEDKLAKIWTVRNGKTLFTLQHSAPVSSLQLLGGDPTAPPLLTASGKRMLLWKGANLVRTYDGFAGAVKACRAVDERVVSLDTGTGTVRCCDMYSGVPLHVIRVPGEARCFDVAEVSGRHLIAIGSSDAALHLFDSGVGRVVLTIPWGQSALALPVASAFGQTAPALSLEDSTGGHLHTATNNAMRYRANGVHGDPAADGARGGRDDEPAYSGGDRGHKAEGRGGWAEAVSERRSQGEVNHNGGAGPQPHGHAHVDGGGGAGAGAGVGGGGRALSQQASVVSNSLADTSIPPHPAISRESTAQGSAHRSLQGESCSLDMIAMEPRDPTHLVGFIRPSQRAWLSHSMVARDLRFVSSAIVEGTTKRDPGDPFLRSPILWETTLDRRFHHGRTFVPQVRIPSYGLNVALVGGSEGLLQLICLSTGRVMRVVAMPPSDRAPIRDMTMQGATLVTAQGNVGGVWRFNL